MQARGKLGQREKERERGGGNMKKRGDSCTPAGPGLRCANQRIFLVMGKVAKWRRSGIDDFPYRQSSDNILFRINTCLSCFIFARRFEGWGGFRNLKEHARRERQLAFLNRLAAMTWERGGVR